MADVRFRAAETTDAEAIAALHADSWRRHYRGAYSDTFLDGDVLTDRRNVWSARLAVPTGRSTIVAELDDVLAGFIHVVHDADPKWGSLVDNLHVVNDRRRSGIGTQLLIRAAACVVAQAATNAMYLWVLEQNDNAQRFYYTNGGTRVEKTTVDPPGGDPTRLNGNPCKLRIAWPDVSPLAHREE